MSILPIAGTAFWFVSEGTGQLLVADVYHKRGIDYLSITDLNPEIDTKQLDKHLKNAESRRNLPIYPELIRTGFLRYVEQLRKQNRTQMNPVLGREFVEDRQRVAILSEFLGCLEYLAP